METSVGEMIKTFRVLKKVTQQELADNLNVSKGTISRYETGKRIPSIATVKAISKILQIPILLLIDNKNNLTNFMDIKNSVDRLCPTLNPILKFLTDSTIQEAFKYNYTELACQNFDEMLIANVENAIRDTLKSIYDIKEREKATGEVYLPIMKSWLTKEQYENFLLINDKKV